MVYWRILGRTALIGLVVAYASAATLTATESWDVSGVACRIDSLSLHNGIESIFDHRFKKKYDEFLLEIDAMRSIRYANSCFDNVISRLKIDCEALQSRIEHKILFAISLAACELENANVTLPDTCIFNLNDEISESELRPCIEHLSKSPQQWTSYTGNFREVISMCFAFQYQHHYANLEDLQRKIARLQLANISLFHDYNRVLRAWKDDELKFAGNFKDALFVLRKDMAMTQANMSASSEISRVLRLNLEDFYRLTKLLGEEQGLVKRSIHDLRSKSEGLEQRFNTQMNRISENVTSMSRSLTSLIEALNAAVSKNDDLKIALYNNESLLDNVANKITVIYEHTKGVETGISTVEDNIKVVDGLVESHNLKTLDVVKSYFGIVEESKRGVEALSKAISETHLQHMNSSEESMHIMSTQHAKNRVALQRLEEDIVNALSESSNKVGSLNREIFGAIQQYSRVTGWLDTLLLYASAVKSLSNYAGTALLFYIFMKMNSLFAGSIPSSLASLVAVITFFVASYVLNINKGISLLCAILFNTIYFVNIPILKKLLYGFYPEYTPYRMTSFRHCKDDSSW